MRAQGQQLDISLLLGLGSSPRPSSKEDLTVEAQLRNVSHLLITLCFVHKMYSLECGWCVYCILCKICTV